MRYNRLCMLAAAIANVSGFFDQLSVAYQHNNPGFFRYESGNLVRFATRQEGYDYLLTDICRFTGKSIQDYILAVAERFDLTYDDLRYYVETASGIHTGEVL
jgi:hypothetical protein